MLASLSRLSFRAKDRKPESTRDSRNVGAEQLRATLSLFEFAPKCFKVPRQSVRAVHDGPTHWPERALSKSLESEAIRSRI
jgi:hypothetical protein